MTTISFCRQTTATETASDADSDDDSDGDDDANMKLSQERTESVVEYLVGKGIAAQRLEAKGFGETQPLVENDSSENKAKNRRVEFKILAEDAPKRTKRKLKGKAKKADEAKANEGSEEASGSEEAAGTEEAAE